MNDYTARIIHADRTAQFRQEADASRLASRARRGRRDRGLAAHIPAQIRRLLLAIARWTERRTDRGRRASSPTLRGGEAAKVTSAAE